mmetsp:Transcript_42697/g.129700  ORF Transcript_42697/g.129700 Transcript_42697/m.129700 type:complete len:250 (+) Transcript_42697:2253-3002(+)
MDPPRLSRRPSPGPTKATARSRRTGEPGREGERRSSRSVGSGGLGRRSRSRSRRNGRSGRRESSPSRRRRRRRQRRRRAGRWGVCDPTRRRPRFRRSCAWGVGGCGICTPRRANPRRRTLGGRCTWRPRVDEGAAARYGEGTTKGTRGVDELRNEAAQGERIPAEEVGTPGIENVNGSSEGWARRGADNRDTVVGLRRAPGHPPADDGEGAEVSGALPLRPYCLLDDLDARPCDRAFLRCLLLPDRSPG